MTEDFPAWVQLLLPALAALAYAVLRLFVRPPKQPGLTESEIKETVLQVSVAAYFGIASVMPVGFAGFIAFVQHASRFWAVLFFSPILISGLLVLYYKRIGTLPSEQHTPKAVALFMRLFFVALFGGYLKLSEIFWINTVKDAASVLQGDMSLYWAGIIFSLSLWVMFGTFIASGIVAKWTTRRRLDSHAPHPS